MVCLQDVVVIRYNPFPEGGDIHYLFCENEDKEYFSGNIALIMLYVQQMLYAVNYLHQSCGVLHLDIKGAFSIVLTWIYKYLVHRQEHRSV